MQVEQEEFLRENLVLHLVSDMQDVVIETPDLMLDTVGDIHVTMRCPCPLSIRYVPSVAS